MPLCALAVIVLSLSISCWYFVLCYGYPSLGALNTRLHCCDLLPTALCFVTWNYFASCSPWWYKTRSDSFPGWMWYKVTIPDFSFFLVFLVLQHLSVYWCMSLLLCYIVSSVPWQVIGCKKCIWNDLFLCQMGCKNLISISLYNGLSTVQNQHW